MALQRFASAIGMLVAEVRRVFALCTKQVSLPLPVLE